MKIRCGFVSNSSSSSYLISVPNTVSNYDEYFIKLFGRCFDNLAHNTTYEASVVSYDDLVEQIKMKIDDNEQEYIRIKKIYNRISEFMANKSKQSAVDQFIKIVKYDVALGRDENCKLRWLDHIDTMRPLNVIQHDYDERMKSVMSDIKKLQEELKNIEMYKDSKYLCKFNLDHHGMCSEEKVIKDLIERGIVNKISMEST